MKTSFIFSALSLTSLFGNFYTVNLDNLENQDIQLIQDQILDPRTDLIVINNQNDLNLELSNFKDFYPNSDPSLPNYLFLSRVKMDHFKAYVIDNNNFLIEAASERLPNIFYYGHFPNLHLKDIECIRSSLLDMDHFLRKTVAGDLVLLNFSSNPLFELCKREIEVTASADTKGNKSASAGITFTSENKTESTKIQGEYTEKENGDRQAKVEVKYNKEF